jgi:hypothetical protein
MKYGYGIVVLAITGFFIADTFYDGKYSKLVKSWKKYYIMAGYAFIGISTLLFLRKNPGQTKDVVHNVNNIVQSMPLNKNSANILAPLSMMANPQSFFNPKICNEEKAKNTIMQSGKKGTKRSVSETKKKFVAAQQSWCCNGCKKQLPAWFEVDHKIRLEYGGSNHVDNLEALCRDCHGRKTSMENL